LVSSNFANSRALLAGSKVSISVGLDSAVATPQYTEF